MSLRPNITIRTVHAEVVCAPSGRWVVEYTFYEIHFGVKLSLFHYGVKLSSFYTAVLNFPPNMGGAKLSKVPNCPMKVLNCPRSIDIWGSVIWGLDIWGLDVQGQMFNLGPEHPILDIGG